MFDFGLYTQVSDSGPHGPLVGIVLEGKKCLSYNQRNRLWESFVLPWMTKLFENGIYSNGKEFTS